MPLHDQTRRLVTLTTFFLLGPILTIVILVGIGTRLLPSQARHFEQALSVQTGMDWKIEAVEYRSPKLVRFHHVSLSDYQASEPIFHANTVDVTFVSTRLREEHFPGLDSERGDQKNSSALEKWKQSFDSVLSPQKGPIGFWQITVPESTLNMESLTTEDSATLVRELLFKLLSRLPALSETPVRLVVDTIHIVSGYRKDKANQPPEQVRFLVGNVYRAKLAFVSDWTFQVPSVSETETLRLSIAKECKGNAFELRFSTGKQPIPCELASVFCSTFRSFGPGSLFSGTLLAKYGNSGTKGPWTIHLRQAFLNNLDVSLFAADYTSFAVTGVVKGLGITKATFGAGTLTAEGWLEVVDGSLDRFLFNRLVDRFALRVEPSSILDAPYASIPFDRCALDFVLQPEGALVYSGQQDNLFMVRKGDGLHTQPMAVCFPPDRRQPIPYHAIMAALAPDTAPIIPLTPGSQRILSMIPASGFDRVSPNGRPGTSLPSMNEEGIAGISSNRSNTLMEDARKRFPVLEPPPIPAIYRPPIANPFTPQVLPVFQPPLPVPKQAD